MRVVSMVKMVRLLRMVMMAPPSNPPNLLRTPKAIMTRAPHCTTLRLPT